MNPIQKIYISCCRKDLWFTKICVASIRYWYPDIPIFLMKDYIQGEFPTSEIEEHWNVGIAPMLKRNYGWGMAKCEAIISPTRERVFILDSDIIMVGTLLESLNSEEDFIIPGPGVVNDDAEITNHYFVESELLKIDSNYKRQSFFNTGSVVTTCGSITREDLNPFIEWSELPQLKVQNVFQCGEQGLINYVVMKKKQLGQISVKQVDFQHWSESTIAAAVDLKKIKKKESYPFLIHWAGAKKDYMSSRLQRVDLLNFYEQFYYSRIKFGSYLRRAHHVRLFVEYLHRFFWNSISGMLKLLKVSLKVSNSR